MTIPSPGQPGQSGQEPFQPPEREASGWSARAASVLFAILCLEVGIFLIVYPWTESWGLNFLVTARPGWTPVLMSDQFRGGITGLGVLNLFLGVYEALRLRRFSSH
jgi:hypothetical protein